MLKVWGRKSSSNVQATMWCVEELKLEYERYDAGFTYGGIDTAEYLALNPNGTIPTLIDGDSPPIWEAGAILRYLASKYGSETFWPKSLVARTHVDKWAEWAKLNIALRFTSPVFWQVVRISPSQRNPALISQNMLVLNGFLDIAEQQLGSHRFMAGDQFTLADIQFGHCLYRYFDIDIERAERPNLQNYYDQLCKRAAFEKHVMVAYEELRVSD